MYHAPEPPKDPPPGLELGAEAAYEVVQVERVVPERQPLVRPSKPAGDRELMISMCVIQSVVLERFVLARRS